MDKARDDKRRFDKELEEYQKKLKLFQQNPSWASKKAEASPEEPRPQSPPTQQQQQHKPIVSV